MPALATGPVRLARASVVATVTVALALVAHVLGGGPVPRPTVLVPLGAVVLAAAVPFGGRRIGRTGAVALLGVGQLALHGAFGVLGGMGCSSPLEMVGHAHAATVQVACAADSAGAASASATAMLAAHVVATLTAALLLAGIDRALAWVATWLRPLLALLAPVALVVRAPLPARVEVQRVVGRTDIGVVPLRGPPMVVAHLALAA